MNPYLFFDLAVLAFVSALVRRKVGRGVVPPSDVAIAEQPAARDRKSSSSKESDPTIECNATSADPSLPRYEFWYPNFGDPDVRCSNDGQEDAYMKASPKDYLFTDAESCCKAHFQWAVQQCRKNSIGDPKWYPAFEGGECRNDGLEPAYMKRYDDYLFDSARECCENYYPWNVRGCLEPDPVDPSFESRKDRSGAATLQKQPVLSASNPLQQHAMGTDSSDVQRHEALEFGTPAMCDNGDGTPRSARRPFPCLILSYSYSNEGVRSDPRFGSSDERHSYHVYGMDGYKSYHRLPASRIAPVRDASANSGRFKALYASFDPTARHPTSGSSQRRQYLHGVVEVKEEGRRRHPPYVVVGHGDGGYLLKSALAPERQAHPSRIRPYRVYEEGTPSLCNIGTWDRPHHVRCTILDHYFVDHGHGRLWYKVSYRTEGRGVEKEDEISFANVQKIDPNGVIV